MSLFPRIFGRHGAPDVALEVASDRVAAARLTAGRDIAAHVVEPLPAGALTPTLVGRNVQDRATVAGVVARVLDALGRPRRVGLLVPDPIARVSLVRLEKVPDRGDELDQLVRWHVRKAVPFAPEETQVAWAPASASADGQEFVVTAARRSVLEEYEGLCTAAGAHPGIVDLSTFNLVNALLTARTPPTSDWLLVNLAQDYVSLALLRDGDLLFFRSRALDGTGAVPDLVHQTAMYYEDRLGGRGLSRIVVAGAAEDAGERGEISQRIASHLPGVVESVAAWSPSVPPGPSGRPVADEVLLPLVGLLRGRRAA
jgi:Tfp pilus assembly PilM family ATPase